VGLPIAAEDCGSAGEADVVDGAAVVVAELLGAGPGVLVLGAGVVGPVDGSCDGGDGESLLMPPS